MKSILAVDDCSEMGVLLKTLLELEGYRVQTALSGAEAFARLAESGGYDLILLDMQLKEMSGSEFLELLEEKHPEIVERVPIVFFTAMEEVPPSRAVGLIRKPVNAKDLLEAVERFVDPRRAECFASNGSPP